MDEHNIQVSADLEHQATSDGERQHLLHDYRKDHEIVIFSGPEDPWDPVNMPEWRKWACATILGAMTFTVTFSSSIFSAAIKVTAEEFRVSIGTMAWATSLFIVGMASGPILMGPSSELYGRKSPLFIAYTAFLLFQIPVGLAQHAQTVLAFRLLAGIAASGSSAIVGGYLADFFPPVQLGVAIAIYSATTLIGPSVGGIIGGIVVQSHLGWRWIVWLTMIQGLVFGGIGFVVLPETYGPVLLTRKAKHLRFTTRNWALHSMTEETRVNFMKFVVVYLSRPFLMLCFEPILLLMTLYISFTLGTIYLLFMAYPISFVQERKYTLVVASLPFIPIIIGIILGSVYVVYYSITTLRRKFARFGKVEPEDRLPPMILGAFMLPIGLIWFAWKSSPASNPWPQVLSGIPIGIGTQLVMLQSLAYIIDIYRSNANSAIAGTVIVRSFIAGAFPVLAIPMYRSLGVLWASSLVGLMALLFAPLPVVFYFHGAKIRSLSRYVPRT